MHPAPLILTLELAPDAFAFFDGLRRRHFPRERNFLPAHVTLFHDLPPSREQELRDHLSAIVRDGVAPEVEVVGVRFLGKGVAYDLRSPSLLRARQRLAEAFADDLTPQDRQPYRPHVTVQNKVTPEVARALHAQLAGEFKPFAFVGTGLLLWHYRGGPWEAAGRYAFAAASPAGEARSVERS
jgi:2'-5' RNA ligase